MQDLIISQSVSNGAGQQSITANTSNVGVKVTKKSLTPVAPKTSTTTTTDNEANDLESEIPSSNPEMNSTDQIITKPNPNQSQKKSKKSKGPSNNAVKIQNQQSKGPKGQNGPKGPKGPKGAKPKPSSRLYFEQIADELAATVSGAYIVQNASSPTNEPAKAKIDDTAMSSSDATREASVSTQSTLNFKKVSSKASCPSLTSRPTFKLSSKASCPVIRTQTNEPAASQTSFSSGETLVDSARPSAVQTRPYRVSHQQPCIVEMHDIHKYPELQWLMARFGGTQHGGLLDLNFSNFLNGARNGAISFIVKDKIAVIGGDPLCEPYLFGTIMDEFKIWRKKRGLGVTVFGGSIDLLEHAKKSKWSVIRFGTERVLNPMDNPVLQEKVQKQIVRQNKQLLDPAKYNCALRVYNPSVEHNPVLQSQLVGVYEAWRWARNSTGTAQAYTTVYDPFAVPSLMWYIYTIDAAGIPNGFAALRSNGAKNGYYIDPCIAAPGAPRRIPDLLYYSAMALLNRMGCSYLSIGMEPSAKLELSGFPTAVERFGVSLHDKIFSGLSLGGKAEYYSKFRPDETLSCGLYLMFPSGWPGVRQLRAVLHFTNISVRRLMMDKLKARGSKKEKDDNDKENTVSKEISVPKEPEKGPIPVIEIRPIESTA